ncbi:MAG: hypothetical protein ACLFTV_12800, partial [Desulfococcaceae bacterium]
MINSLYDWNFKKKTHETACDEKNSKGGAFFVKKRHYSIWMFIIGVFELYGQVERKRLRGQF